MAIKKQGDWVTTLMNFIQEVYEKPFVWGEWDCCVFADEALYRITGKRVIPKAISGWKTEKEARETIKKYGKTLGESLHKAATKAGMEEIELPYLTTGDLVCFKSEDNNELAAICNGQWLFVPTDDGLTHKSKSMALRAWRVNG